MTNAIFWTLCSIGAAILAFGVFPGLVPTQSMGAVRFVGFGIIGFAFLVRGLLRQQERTSRPTAGPTSEG